MHFLYVLKSEINSRLYIGVTEDLSRRIEEHNAGKTPSTKAYIPYKLIYSECYQNRTEALQREKQIKRSGKIWKELKEGIYKAPSSIG